MKIVSPYTRPQRMLKGNFHTHTTASDGKASLEEVIALYRDDNYDFLAITDHRRLHDGTDGADAAGGMLLLPGQECHIRRGVEFDYHVVGLGITRQIDDQDTGQGLIDAINASGGVAIVAHPRWSYMPYEVFDALEGYAAFEVFNGGCTDVGRASSHDYWDRYLTLMNRPIWGVSIDDMHKPEHDFATGWTWVNAEREAASIFDALRRGDFYASSGPRIENILVNERSITLHTTSARFIKFITRHGIVAKWADGKHVKKAVFEPTGEEPFVRAEVHGHDGTIAWTNPFMIEDAGERRRAS